MELSFKAKLIGSLVTFITFLVIGQAGFYVVALFFEDKDKIYRMKQLYTYIMYFIMVTTMLLVIYL